MTAELSAMAIPMADELAAMDLVSSATALLIDKVCWLDIAPEQGVASARPIRDRAVTYLSLRGRLARHPRFPNLVRIQGVEHVQSR
jgi:hypothetical protein